MAYIKKMFSTGFLSILLLHNTVECIFNSIPKYTPSKNIIYSTIKNFHMLFIIQSFFYIATTLKILKDQHNESQTLFSAEEKKNIEAIINIKKLKNRFFSRGMSFEPLCFCLSFWWNTTRIYNPNPRIAKEIPEDCINLIKEWACKLQVRVDAIQKLDSTKYPGCSKVTFFETIMEIQITKWVKYNYNQKRKIIIHELAHLALRHHNKALVSVRTAELQAETYFALFGPHKEEVTDIFLCALKKDSYDSTEIYGNLNPESKSYSHPSCKEIHTIITHAKKLREAKHKTLNSNPY